MSYSLKISPKDRATGRFKSRVNRKLLNAVLKAKQVRGLTQSEIAELMGVDKSTVSKILNGRGNLTLKTIGDISWAVGLAPDIEFIEEVVEEDVFLSNSGIATKKSETQNSTQSMNVIQYNSASQTLEKTSSRPREVKLQELS